jgi:hypothetical protein
MDEPGTSPEEKPRFLLPDGCKDLIDALRLEREDNHEVAAETSVPLTFETKVPTAVWIREPITVRDLATALAIPPHRVVAALMTLNVFASLTTEIDFTQAAGVCWHYGVIAHKVP